MRLVHTARDMRSHVVVLIDDPEWGHLTVGSGGCLSDSHGVSQPESSRNVPLLGQPLGTMRGLEYPRMVYVDVENLVQTLPEPIRA